MHVLHAHWHFPTKPTEQGGMLFWAEDSEISKPPSPKKGKQGKSAKPHPFCAAPETVRDFLGTYDPDAGDSQINWITLLLPSDQAAPRPSPQLVHDWDIDENGAPALTPWVVAGAWLKPVEAFHLLTTLAGADDLPAQWVLGSDIRYWQLTTNLILETLAMQKLLPVLAQPDADRAVFHARWLPVLDGSQDGPRIGRLLEGMPPLCRAEADAPDDAPPPRAVLETFLNTIIDSLARQWGRPGRPSFLSKAADPVHGWLNALFESDPQVGATAAQLKHLHKGHQLWLRNLHLAGDKVFRIAFRLEAPMQQGDTTQEKNWLLHFLLQAREDPSLLVPAQQVWQTKGKALTALNHRFEQPQEKLLAGLGFAARLFEPLRDGLKTSNPTALTLSTPQAFDFLRETAVLLESSGFGVLVPPWWNKPGTRLGIRLKMSGRSKGPGADVIPKSKMTLSNLIRYKWELSLGGQSLSEQEFRALVDLKAPLVQIRGQWVQLDPEQIEAAIRFWEKQDLEAEVDMQEALQLGLGATDEVEGLPVEGVEFEGWFDDWMKRFTGGQQLTTLPPPEKLQAKLRPYQQYGYSWLEFLQQWGMGACLADDMGLGKTLQTIALILRHKEEQGSLPGPVLVVCPTSVVANWVKEVERFAPALTTMMHQGPDRLRDAAFIEQAKEVDIVLTGYAVVRRDADIMQAIDWFGVVLDEAQNIKNPLAKQTRIIRQLPTQFRLALTGTPVENRLSELWSIMQFLNPGFLGSRQNFKQNFALPIERYGDEPATNRLKKMVGPFILRRMKTDPSVIQDLPEKQEMKVYCNLSEEQATLYESVVQSALHDLAEVDGIERKGMVLSMLMKLKQVCNHPAQFLHQIGNGHNLDLAKETERSGKLARLTEMLEEAISVGDRVLIFSQFSEMGQFLKSHLQERLGVQVLFLHGGTPADKRPAMIRRFQEDPNGPPIFVLSLKAGGTGLNLTRANHVFHFDRWWNPAVEDQATDRAFRIGQTRNVQVHKFVCVGTLEEQIDEMIESKKALARSVVGSGENWLTELSTDGLRDLVMLRKKVIK
jgi:SNF2 family DNA or RNA helicase